jgi:hypothetical protein
MKHFANWSAVVNPGAAVLIVVDSDVSQLDEVSRVLDAVERAAGLSAAAAVVPAALRSWMIRQGLQAARVLPRQLHGVDVELSYFLESPLAIQWAIQQRCDFVTGSQPYLPLNEEVKAAFEQRIAALTGHAEYIAHTLPDQHLFAFTTADLWSRAGRSAALDAHAGRQQLALAEVHRRWVQLGGPSEPAFVPEVAAALAALNPPTTSSSGQLDAALEAAIPTLSRVTDALEELSTTLTAPAIRVAPPGAIPAAGWMPPHVEAIWESHYVAPAVKWEGPRLAMRAPAAGAYSYLFISAEEDLRRGDAAVAAGRVFRGGVTVGLQRNGEWISRVDVDQPGRFVVMVVAQEAGDYQLGIANCLRGTESTTAFALRRFGWTRRER